MTRLGQRIKSARERALRQPDENGFRVLQEIEELTNLRIALDREIDKNLLRARDQGASWVSIGGAMYATKQAAQQRHAKAASEAATAADGAARRAAAARSRNDGASRAPDVRQEAP